MPDKPLVVCKLAFTTRKGRRGGNSTGSKEFKRLLKYFQYRDDRHGHIPQEAGKERWTDCGLGNNYRSILRSCEHLGSARLLAWAWVVSPAPDLMALVPEDQKESLVQELTEAVVEQYYTARDSDVPEFSYVLHDRSTGAGQQQLHTHIILPATVPEITGGRTAFDNRANKGHLALLQEIADQHLSHSLDRAIGPDWRQLRPTEWEMPSADRSDDLEAWFPREVER